ncbi:hypothetical protein SAMN02745116_01788 [Pilibacter termitis]|uniref:Uncharacterized protein n=1 Tax=Pilibacter termitis TaxID=263852 RepID=A0A1T4PES2_9ENTE|nr:hypothetical protein [Pilibacter termitis]SJZ90044.1 hypothetical protein SAMN02745116_01788 [Pilibacter termitis]
MSKINITNTNVEADGNVKISYNATFTDNSYISGHTFISVDEYEDLTTKQLRRKIAEVMIENVGAGL